jgi:uncharacterized protein YjbJ (UPF0337 family)
MNDELAGIAGKYEDLVGRLQERYGTAKEDGDQQIKDFKKTIGQLKKSNSRLVRLQKSLQEKERKNKRPAKRPKPSKTRAR